MAWRSDRPPTNKDLDESILVAMDYALEIGEQDVAAELRSMLTTVEYQKQYTTYEYRIVWDYEDSPDFSFLDQWYTFELYYDMAPGYTGRRPPPRRLWGKNAGVVFDGRRAIPFEEYQETYGNPDYYVSLWAYAQKRLATKSKPWRGWDEDWTHCCSLGNIMFTRSTNFQIGAFDEEDIDRLITEPYQLEISHELINEARGGH